MKPTCWLVLLLICFSAHAVGQPLRVVAFEIEPFFYLDDGQPAGIDYEILEYFAKSQGRELEIRWVDAFPDLFTRLLEDEGDVASAAITITAERQSRFDFSKPYFPSQLRLIDRQDAEVSNLESLAGARVGAMAGSIGHEFLSSLPNVTIQSYESVYEAFRALATGEVRAIAAETAAAFLHIQEFSNLHIGLPLREPEHYGFAVQKGSPLQAALSEHIEKLKSSGIYFRLLEKYLGSMAAEVVRAGKK